MIYILTTVLYGIGCFLMAMQTIKKLRAKYPQFSFKSVWATFFIEEWNTLMTAAGVWLLLELFLYVAIWKGVVFPYWFDVFGLFGLSLVLGYAGTRLIYSAMGTTEKYLEKKLEKITDSNG